MDMLFEETFTYPKGPYSRPDLWDYKTKQRTYCDWVGQKAFSIDGMKHLVITAHKNEVTGRWESGEISGSVKLTGKRHIEARIACPKGFGTWPAFWEWGYPWGSAPSLEIDVMERLGKEAGHHCTIHNWLTESWDHPQKGVHIYDGTADLHNFHIYGADVLPDRILFYFDKQEIFEVLSSDVGYGDFTKAVNCLVLDLDMGGSWAGPISCASPQKMVVDYVRAARLL